MGERPSTGILLLFILWCILTSLAIFLETSKWTIHATIVGVAILCISNWYLTLRTKNEGPSEQQKLARVFAPKFVSEYAIIFPDGFLARDVPPAVFRHVAKYKFPYAPIRVVGEQMVIRADLPLIDVV